MKPILRKTENITLVRQGAYGCHWPVWSSVEAWQAAGSPGPVVIRYAAGGAGSGPCLYGIQPADVPQEIDKLKEQGWRQDRIYLNLEMPLEGLLLQGEYYNTAPPDDVLLFSRARLHMRPALLQVVQPAACRPVYCFVVQWHRAVTKISPCSVVGIQTM